MIEITVKLFAVVRDLAGTDTIAVRVPIAAQASSVLDLVIERYPQLEKWKHHLRIAVNCEYVTLHQHLQNGDEVALIPPVSGG